MNYIEASSYRDLSRKAANLISAQIIMKPDSILGLATGSTPVGIYQQLIEWYRKGDLDFSGAITVNLDEYCGLSGEHEQSYRYFMNHNFFDHINIKKENTHIPDGMAKDQQQECIRYDSLIESLKPIDLQLLGIGHNGHIGFNEPDISFEKTTHIVELKSDTIKANSRFFASMDQVPQKAITMGIKSIMNAKKILLVANGKEKKEAIDKAFRGPVIPEVPASILQFHPDLTVIYCPQDK